MRRAHSRVLGVARRVYRPCEGGGTRASCRQHAKSAHGSGPPGRGPPGPRHRPETVCGGYLWTRGSPPFNFRRAPFFDSP